MSPGGVGGFDRVSPRDRRGLVLAAAGLLAAAVLLPALGTRSLADWDEAIYAQVALEMLERGDLLVPFYRGEPFFEKPPLYFWLTAAVYRLAGVTELAARLGSAVAGIGLALLVAGLGRALGGRWVGIGAPLVLLSGPGLVLSARSGMLDVPLTLTVWLALAAYLRTSREAPRWWYGVALAIAAGAMLKSVAVLVAPLAMAASLVLGGDRRARLAPRQVWRATALGLVLVAAWPLAMLTRFGSEFVDVFWRYHVVARALEPLETHTGGALFHLRLLPTMVGAWVWLLPVAAVLAVRRAFHDRRLALPVFLLGAVATALPLMVRTRIAWYLVPALPAVALFVAAAIDEARRARRPWILAALALSSLAPVAMAGGSVRIVAAGCLVAGAVAAARWGRDGLVVGMTVALALVSFASLRATYSSFRHPVAELAGAIAAGEASPSPLVLYPGSPPNPAVDNHEPSAVFYSRRPVITAHGRDELAAAIQRGARHLLLPESARDELEGEIELEIVARARGLIVVESLSTPPAP